MQSNSIVIYFQFDHRSDGPHITISFLGTIQFNPHQVESHQNAIVNYLDQKAEASHEKNLVDRSLDRAGYARVVKVIGSAKSNDYRGVTQVSNFKEIPKVNLTTK